MSKSILNASAALLVLVTALASLAACAPRATGREEISREQAIEIARKHVTFKVQRTEAVKETDEGREVWRVTFYGEPMTPSHPMAELTFVLVDRFTGEVVSLGMS